MIHCIDVIAAQEQLRELQNADFPSVKKETRDKLWKLLKKTANPTILKEEKRAITTQELASLLNKG